MAQHHFELISPVDGSKFATIPYATESLVASSIDAAKRAYLKWRTVPLDERIALVRRIVASMARRAEQFARLVTMQMGRPLHQADEVGRLCAITEELITVACVELARKELPSADSVRRFTELLPCGICLSICPWNYPVAMAGSLVIAPLLAGNVVIFKHSPQTALIADLMLECFKDSGGIPNAFQALHLEHEQVARLIASGDISILNFVGSERGGREVHRAAAGRYISIGLELGGKDPAYVRPDANLSQVVPELIDGSFSNAGQSCCSVERIYVHEAVYDDFVEQFVEAARLVTLGHPINEKPFVGPVVSEQAAKRIYDSIKAAAAQGAQRALAGRPQDYQGQGAYLAPEVLVNVTHDMSVMREETFGPVAPIMKVGSDAEAVHLMNDSVYGLTASIWSADLECAFRLGLTIEAGTFYVNRCDHADLKLPWGGVKGSGVGRSLGPSAFDRLTALKGYHVRNGN